jgi:hypothetical protein
VPLASEIHESLPFLGMPMRELLRRFDGRVFSSDHAEFEKRLRTVAALQGSGSNPLCIPLADVPGEMDVNGPLSVDPAQIEPRKCTRPTSLPHAHRECCSGQHAPSQRDLAGYVLW